MSQAEERSTPPQKAGYRAPGTMVAGRVEKLTGGGDGGDYSDYNGGWRGLAASRDDEQASEDATGGAPPKQDDAEE